jgi:antitoxin HicB
MKESMNATVEKRIRIVYPVDIETVDGEYIVSFPDFGWGATSGNSLAEALAEAEDCLSEILAQLIQNGEEIPLPSDVEKGQYCVSPTAEIAIKALLYLTLQEVMKGNKSVLADRLGKDEKTVRRLVDPHHKSKLGALDNALHAMGKRLVISLRDADTC